MNLFAALFANGETQLGRAFVNERPYRLIMPLHVLDYERASEVIQNRHARGHRHVLLPS